MNFNYTEIIHFYHANSLNTMWYISLQNSAYYGDFKLKIVSFSNVKNGLVISLIIFDQLLDRNR